MKKKAFSTLTILLGLLLTACLEGLTSTGSEPSAPTATLEPIAPATTVPAMIERSTPTVEPGADSTTTTEILLYRHEGFGFGLPLPPTWAGYHTTHHEQDGLTSICFSFPDSGPMCILQIDIYRRATWSQLRMVPPDYYLGENERYIFASGPYGSQCVQLDPFQCARYKEIPGILAGFVTESLEEGQPDLVYLNETYGFRLPLPDTWVGYLTTQHVHGDVTHICFTFPASAPVCVLQIDVFTREMWKRAVDLPPDYYRGENEQFVFAAGPYDEPCIQLDEFQCARHREIPDILAGLTAVSIGERQTELSYHNDTFGFSLTLPDTWTGYQTTEHEQEWVSDICFTFPDHGHICVLKIDIHTQAAWDSLSKIPPDYYLSETDRHVFAAGPYHNLAECVQLDAFQCNRRQEVPAILASFRLD